jgi:hypothetical protein
MKSSLKRALVIDSRTSRRIEITSVLRSVDIEVKALAEIVKKSGNGCDETNLDTLDDLLEQVQVVFLHLRPCEKLKPNDLSGNECSMAFLRHNHIRMKDKCLIAYGGKLEVPAGFKELSDPGWHRFFGGILSAEQMKIKAFVQRWNEDSNPAALPPLDALVPDISLLVNDFRMLLGLYQSGSAADYIQRPETWRELCSEHAEKLLQGLTQQVPDSPLVGLARQLRDWFGNPDAAHAAAVFDAKMHDALMATPAWVGADANPP